MLHAKIGIIKCPLSPTKVAQQRDKSQENERELKASEFDLNYVALEGIGCMVNGAGLGSWNDGLHQVIWWSTR